PRRQWIEKHVEFSMEDSQNILENENMMVEEAKDI
ncbi:hypothetical protein, partial [Listeria monocytogenes]